MCSPALQRWVLYATTTESRWDDTTLLYHLPMFVGHFGLALAAKRVAPRTNLALLIAAAEFVDILWPIFLLLGVERVAIQPGVSVLTPLNFLYYPWTHSLLMSIVWAIVFAAVYFLFTREKRTALVLAALVVSHWFLDYLTHIPDLPLAPGTSSKYGLSLWNHPFATIALELGIFFSGLFFYLKATRPLDRIGRVLFACFILFLVFIYIMNFLGPPPPSVRIMTFVTLFGTLVLFLWAWWVDRHREPSV